jgi:hypothetical protein
MILTFFQFFFKLFEHESMRVLKGYEQAAGVGRREQVDEELVGEDVQLLDLLALNVDVACRAEEVRNAGSADSGADGLRKIRVTG